jgi:hypothetical protein
LVAVINISLSCYDATSLMSPSESELMAARIARMKILVADLETACAANADNREKFLKLKAELDAARAALTLVLPPA